MRVGVLFVKRHGMPNGASRARVPTLPRRCKHHPLKHESALPMRIAVELRVMPHACKISKFDACFSQRWRRGNR
jgi:hypothetical protein